jgi:hypothetical protein
MIKDVVREHHWPPYVIGGFFVDSLDYNGLVYWSNDVREVYKNTAKPKTKNDKD